MVALNVRLSVGSLAWGRSCGRLYVVTIYGRLARYLVRFLFFTWRTLQSCELVVLWSVFNGEHWSWGRIVPWSVVQPRTPFLQTTSPMVGCSLSSRHVSWLEVCEHSSAVVNDVHQTASTIRLRASGSVSSFIAKKWVNSVACFTSLAK